MKALLINPSWTESLGRFAEIARERTYSPPLGICYIAAVARERGHQIQILDAEAERLCQSDEILKRVKALGPDLIGITSTSPVFPKALELAKVLKDNLKLPLVIGGSHVNVSKEKAFAECFDFAVFGDGEYTFSMLLEHLEKNLGILIL